MSVQKVLHGWVGVACIVTALSILSLIDSAAGTVAYWRFEEGTPGSTASGSGSILDYSGNNLHGTPYGGVSYTSNIPNITLPQTGEANHLALAFDGASNTRVVIPDDPLFELSGSFTLEAWINLTTLPAPGYQWQILFRGDSRGGLDPYYIDIWDDALRFTINDEPSGGARVFTSVPALNQWTHVAGVFDEPDGRMSLYVDGLLAHTLTTTVRPFLALDPDKNPGVSIGGYPDDHYGPFHGMIDEVRITSAALSPNQFLNTVVPTPAAVGIGLLGMAMLGTFRRKRS